MMGLKKGYSMSTCKMVVAQSRLESANYGSDLAKRANNIFGMRPAKHRERHYQFVTNNYAGYSSVYNSVTDYFALANKNGMPKNFDNIQEFAEYLKSTGYYTTSEATYLQALKSWL